MRKRCNVVFRILVTAAVIGAAMPAAAQEADVLLAKADAVFRIERFYQKSSMVVEKGGRPQPAQVIETWFDAVDGTAKSLSVFMEPKRMQGTAYLSIGDTIWFRYGSTGRIREIGVDLMKSSTAGSDFSYADMGEGNQGYLEKYDAVAAGSSEIDGAVFTVMELIPKSAGGENYEKLRVYLDAQYRYSRVEIFDNGSHIKTMFLEDYRDVAGLSYPFVVRMENHTRNSRTTVTTEAMVVDSPVIRDEYFTLEYLQAMD